MAWIQVSVKLLAVLVLLQTGTAQKLLFKPYRARTEGLKLNQDDIKTEEKTKGFGFEHPKEYFTSDKSALHMAEKPSVGPVVCPGNQSACPEGNTCCKTSLTGYGCCPLPQAVCCQDSRHCCPFGLKCDIGRQACISLSGEVSVAWFEKQPSFPVNNNKGNVQCDSTHACPDGNTCCQLASGQWGCCPLPNAVCCDDHVHCCPENTKCDVSSGKCLRGNIATDWFVKTPSMEVSNVKCDSTHECPDGNTCCQLASDQWGCCPLPNAVCCDDHVHCCPENTKCDVSSGKCLRGNFATDWFVKTPSIEVGNVQCDSTHACPDGNTCCQLASGQWGCCPLPNAVCCDDHVHCCPENTKCDVSSGKCLRGNFATDWFVKTPSIEVGNVQCDSTHACPDGNTCCQLASGQWGCCPLPNAVCCDDHVHCCPENTKCDVSSGKCLRGNIATDWFVKTPSMEVGNVQCDSTHACPDGNTCCQLASGQWGCCPLPNAVCCDDHVHCCPENTKCDVSSGKCLRGNVATDWFLKTPSVEVGNVQCDSTHACPDGNTCCQLASGQWGCCPLPNAVCCDDHVHCCPENTKCDVSSGKCLRGNIATDWFVKTPSMEVGNVQCDSTHACPDGNTCCQLASGQWGCCPLPNAVCCDDHVHCCPENTKCDVSSGKCLRGNIATDWFVKTPSVEVGNVQCDSTHACPDGNTCCQLASGQWGCCPLPNAVCCDDHVHCCPANTKCDVSSGKCLRGNFATDWFVKTPSIEVGNVQCDSTHACPDGNTCCQLASGQWGCCPLPNAVCCDDHVHCCPENTKCDVSSGKCLRGNIATDWFVKTPSMEVGNVQCDSTHACPDGNTCCQLASGQWGCCPLPNAVCCDDHVHCCPENTKCDVSSGKCLRGNIATDWFVKTPSMEVGNVQCDSTHACPDGNTCCQLASGQWGCCPLPNAVCCDDHVHCCPANTKCDVSSGKCLRGNVATDWFVKTPSVEVGNVQCDSTHACPDGNTCCQLASGQWGCCPLPNAVCCDDHVHCCPENTKCDVSSGKCLRGNFATDWFVKTPSIEVGNVQCDSTHACPDGNTCCQLASGQWGCCPLPNAVCCDDHVHCCPENTKCDVSSGKCLRGNIATDWFVKTPSMEVGNVQCDSTHACPDGNTCCQLASGQWGCCSLPNAVCCDDHVHCCPENTKCDVSSGKCLRGNVATDWFVKTPSVEVGNVQCDSTHACPDGNTCCQLASGQWGCCPLPNAVCCDDHVHCCPANTKCDVSSGKCLRGNIATNWFIKTPSIEVSNVKCDSTHACPDGNTCCQLASGQWGCCPLPNAVCCDDHVHCCPENTKCDVSSGKCLRGNIAIDWFVRTSSMEVGNVQCDSTHACPDGNTCCQLASGQWGCCPLPNAVCCDDHVHCCPENTKCDVSSGKCLRGNFATDWFVKTPSIEVGNVQCDSTHACPDGNTCCQLASGQWGCCPLPNAVCCDDHVHCCPENTKCDVSSGKCLRGNVATDWFVKTPSVEVGNMQCDSTHACPDGNTCCQLASGQWGCCPLPNAVCCDDHVHCCPENTKCDVSSGKCLRGNVATDWFVKTPSVEVGNVQCDSTHACPDGNTCCQLASGQWGCCPLPNAVCCDDHVHCCPESTKCDVSSGKCLRGNIATDWFVRNPSIEVNNVKCDSTHECPDGNTCCQLASGQWGCCPLPNAVCCDDHVHCCPENTKCDTTAGKCLRGSQSFDWYLKSSVREITAPLDLLFGKTKLENVKDVVCPDGSECQDGQTCCPMDDNVESYGCCPLPNAVCCEDREHCCPSGYRCNLSSGTCIRGSFRFPLIPTRRQKKPKTQRGTGADSVDNDVAITLKESSTIVHSTVCPDGTSCPEKNTCCDNGGGGFNCCPMPSGVCCDDHKYCCPNGYICDTLPGSCRIPETNSAVSNFLQRLTVIRAVKHN